MSMTLKKWRRGFALAIFLGTLSAGAGLASGVTWRQFVAILCTSLLASIGTYLMKSPLDQVDDDTTITTKSDK